MQLGSATETRSVDLLRDDLNRIFHASIVCCTARQTETEGLEVTCPHYSLHDPMLRTTIEEKLKFVGDAFDSKAALEASRELVRRAEEAERLLEAANAENARLKAIIKQKDDEKTKLQEQAGNRERQRKRRATTAFEEDEAAAEAAADKVRRAEAKLLEAKSEVLAQKRKSEILEQAVAATNGRYEDAQASLNHERSRLNAIEQAEKRQKKVIAAQTLVEALDPESKAKVAGSALEYIWKSE